MLDPKTAKTIRICLSLLMFAGPLPIIRLNYPGKELAIPFMVIFEMLGILMLPLLYILVRRGDG